MTPQERINLVDKLAQRNTDEQPLEALVQFYYEDQFEYYDSLSDEELEDEKI